MSAYEYLLERPSHCDHLVQFYGADDRVLTRNVSQYLAEGLRRNDRVLVVASAERAQGFIRQLDALQASPHKAIEEGRLAVHDALTLLNTFMVGDRPDWNRFDLTIGATVRDLGSRAGAGGLRAYGEMVDILWKQDMCDAAIELEDFWNRLLKSHNFSLYCAYSLDVFADNFNMACVSRILGTHTHLLPSGTDRALQHALDRAIEDILGADAPRDRTFPEATERPGAQLPKTEAAILWLRQNRPDAAPAVMHRARQIYEGTETFRQTPAFSD
ncbi:MAG: MEDS domain-containing protein [Acidobacteriota bacterium]|nr:MEDS domain-containing protein [Acidobacteriota bacterium]